LMKSDWKWWDSVSVDFFLITDPFSSTHQLSIIFASSGYPRQ
jgi:hypothetical protein